MIEISTFNPEDIDKLQSLIHLTIKTNYPSVYAPEIVDFFLDYHSKDEIIARSQKALILVLKKSDIIVATGFLLDEELGGVYVHPDHQKLGLGRIIVVNLLNNARAKGLKRIHLDSTPIAKKLYENLGFIVTEEVVQMVGKVPLPYFKMELYL
jgi:GNAT superfamily N-acetyltransferase